MILNAYFSEIFNLFFINCSDMWLSEWNRSNSPWEGNCGSYSLYSTLPVETKHFEYNHMSSHHYLTHVYTSFPSSWRHSDPETRTIDRSKTKEIAQLQRCVLLPQCVPIYHGPKNKARMMNEEWWPRVVCSYLGKSINYSWTFSFRTSLNT